HTSTSIQKYNSDLLSQCPAAAYSTRRCHSIYKGFAQCLMSLGDSLTDNARKDEDTHEIHSICRSWDEFHDCANVAMAGCPDEAAAVWESLRQESKKMQFSGNLYDMCSNLYLTSLSTTLLKILKMTFNCVLNYVYGFN
uniref:Neuritin 1-like a n=1 Tax=Labrus bergylta TaxID=56723 RepID=A0A3Q3EXG3_9LABR